MGKYLARYLDSLSDSLLGEQRVDLMAHKKDTQLVLYLVCRLDFLKACMFVSKTALLMVHRKESVEMKDNKLVKLMVSSMVKNLVRYLDSLSDFLLDE